MSEQTLTIRELFQMIHAQCAEIISMRLYIYRNLFPWFAEGFSKAAKEGLKWFPGSPEPIPAPLATLFARADEVWVALTGLPPITDRLSVLSAAQAAGLSHDRIAAMSKTELWDAITAWALCKRSAASRENVSAANRPQYDDCESRLLALYIGDAVNERIRKAAAVLRDTSLNADEKLEQIDRLIKIPPNVSSRQLGDLLGITHQAVTQTDWWRRHKSARTERKFHGKEKECIN